MEPDLESLAATLVDQGVDGYLIDDGSDFADQRYLSGFDAERFLTLYTSGQTAVLVSGKEYARATNESRADTVRRWSDYDYQERREREGSAAARRAMIADFLAEFDVSSITVPGDFPLRTAEGLRSNGVSITVDEVEVIENIRATKTVEEAEHIRAAQAANEAAMRRAEELLTESEPRDGILHHKGKPLTSEAVSAEIEITVIRHGCSLDQTIVAGGADGAEPHNRGAGPLPANEPIVIDIFPKDSATKYYADMTRTFVVGEPEPEVRKFHDLTIEAMDVAFELLGPGVTGAAVHDAVCDVYEAAGYPTLRSDANAELGFIHNTGHGVGLDIHELPSLGPGGGELEPGHVVTIEPGLYDPDVGGVRVEDLAVVTSDGYENLTDYHRDLIL